MLEDLTHMRLVENLADEKLKREMDIKLGGCCFIC